MAAPADFLQKPIITYTAPPTFIASPNWHKVLATISAQLPLRNIHWKPVSQTTLRTIQELDVNLVPFESLRDELTSQVPVTLLEKPLLHIFVFHCEDSDVEAYRNLHKRFIKDWQMSVSNRKNQDWLILHIIRPDPSKMPTGKLFAIKNSVLDKLRTDFNLDKREHCVQLNWNIGNDNPQVWAEFVNKLKEGLLYAFDLAISQRQEEVKRSENQQSMPGWNFCTFFILKESLASSFEGMNLLEEALVPYDELEALFQRVSREKNMSWFGNLIQPEHNDDSQPLLSVNKKKYREMILANSISVFDFRIYLLSRQCQLLAKMGLIHEATTKVGFFLGTLGKRLRDVEASLPPLFIEAWAYSSALSTVEQCNAWVKEYKIDTSKPSTNAGKAELLDIARSQLDIIGIEASHLPPIPPFTSSTSWTSRLSSVAKLSFSNETLNVAVGNRQAFNELYVALTNRAIDLYAKSGRRKFALKLHGTLAAFECNRGNLSAALNTFISLPAHYSPYLWNSLEGFMLSRAVHTHEQLDKPQDTEWVHIVLAFLKSYVDHRGEEMLMYDVDATEYVARLVDSLRSSVEQLEAAQTPLDLPHPDHPALTVSVADSANLAETRDGSYLEATITNHLPVTFPTEEINVSLSGRESEKVKFNASISDGLPPGHSHFTLYCKTSAPGTFLLESSEIRSSHLVLSTNYRKAFSKPSSRSTTLIRIPSDPLALDVRISQSSRIVLGSPQSLMAVLSTGRNQVRKAIVRLSSPSATFRCREACLEEGMFPTNIGVSFEATKDGVTLEDIPDGSEISFMAPHSDASALTAMKVNIEVDYVTVQEPDVSRTARFSRVLITTLPLSVNVEDFFRGTRLISKFTVSTTSHQHIRISDARLDLPNDGVEGVTVERSSSKRRIITVTPHQPANFLFALNSTKGPVRESLNLSIKYRMLREEVESVIQKEVGKLLEDYPDNLKQKIVLISKLVDALESDAGWVDMYGITGELLVPDLHVEDGDLAMAWTMARKRLAEHRHPESPEGSWREIQIPVDVPFMNIVAAARLRVVSTPFASASSSGELPSLYAGQPISADLLIHTTFHWGLSPSEHQKQYLLRFNIEEMVREWLVSGPKRGDFIATDNAMHIVPITLIALHHGEFLLPKITVSALPISGTLTMGSLAVPSIETYQVHGAEKVLILPRGGRSTFVISMGPG
ncbi:trafficking protein particle complex subunit 10 [Crepidotus variabilis]|uniref:Trafficking protein particle complex subunit 10 n=1 Tax=Crepidotus variabilis TaxID=179855 RepID=A0A9P6JVK6_9AGAR|nr:trafficking protein particle complex subunit 10 [Crepidotus variabilis]